MDSSTLLTELAQKLQSKEIDPADVLRVIETSKGKNESHASSSKILPILGATIVIIGIIAFVSQIWGDIGSAGRIFITLGIGFIFTALGSILLKNRPHESIGTIFHAIGGSLIPGGAMVTLSELSTGQNTLWPVAITFGMICAFYCLLTVAHRKPLLTFFAILNGTIFLYAFTGAMIDGTTWEYYDDDALYAYLTMAIGVSDVLCGSSFQNTWNKKLVPLLYFFGSLGFFGATFSRVFDSFPWQVIFGFVLMGGFMLSAKLRSTSILVMSAIFLIAHMTYITSEYFADSLGWPLCLIILGLLFIALGQKALQFNREYVKG